MTRAFIGLGSNQGDPARQFDEAVAALAALPRTRVTRRSANYRSAPVGDTDQSDFLNAVVELETAIEPLELLRRMHEIEDRQGRVRDPRRCWGPRTLDLDLLLFGDAVIRDEELVVPHPRMTCRAFVLRPLADLAPGLSVPGHDTVAALLEDLDTSGVRPVDDQGAGPGG